MPLAELVALTRALELNKATASKYLHRSKYAYLTLHTHATIQKERQFKTTGEPTKHFREIQTFNCYILSKKVAVIHYKGHSRDQSKVAEDNQLADCQARKAALYETPSLTADLFDLDRSCGTGKTTIY